MPDSPRWFLRASRLVWIALLASLCGCATTQPDLRHPPPDFQDLVASATWLSNPTASGVSVSFVPSEAVSASVGFREPGRATERRTSPVSGPADELLVLNVEGLEPSREYEYRLWLRTDRSGGGPAVPGPWHRVRTLRSPGDTVRFAFATDSHAIGRWIRAHCGEDIDSYRVLERTLELVSGGGYDFVILGGDEAMTRRRGGPECAWNGRPVLRPGPPTPAETHLRYRLLRHLFAPVAADAPVFLTLGNHDGEAGFDGAPKPCGHVEGLSEMSRAARLAHLPNPSAVYSGGPDGNYFAFESGDALFVVLDVMRYTTTQPRNASDWTLGEEQLAWLERTLSRSSAAWKLLFAHHLVGGLPDRSCYHYGRGGARATEDGTLRGRFLGEQSDIHALMKRTGAQVFFFGHDHLFCRDEKLGPDGTPEGVHYVTGGVTSGTRTRWRHHPWAKAVYPEETDHGSGAIYERGFVDVTVEGPKRIALRYVGSAPHDPAVDGAVLYERVIERD
jgi:3',5'-cyclic AMP phosphodiesterase CpdA